MMSENIILKRKPKIEFQFRDDGFQLIDEQTERNSGFYSYHELQTVELNNAWFPKLAKWLRTITWLLNAVPYFPDAESYKKANIIILLKKGRLGIWLTDSYMAIQAKLIKKVLEEKVH